MLGVRHGLSAMVASVVHQPRGDEACADFMVLAAQDQSRGRAANDAPRRKQSMAAQPKLNECKPVS